MIKKRVGTTLGAILEIMIVVDSYVNIESSPVVDLINSRGQRFEGCDVLNLGGVEVDIFTLPAKDSEVLTITSPFSTPYVLGAISSEQTFLDEIALLPSGEYPSDVIGKDDVLIKRQDTRLILSDKIHQTSTRVQGNLEISDGAIPALSATLAEPLLNYITALQATITELNANIEAVAILAQVQPPPVVVPPAIPAITSQLVKIER